MCACPYRSLRAGKGTAVGLKASPGPLYGFKADLWAALAVAVTVADMKAAYV